MSSAEPSLLQEFTAKYKDTLIISGVIVAAIASSGNLAINADMPTESGNASIRSKLDLISARLASIEHDVSAMNVWQQSKEKQLDGRGAFMSCAVQQIQENRRAANAEKVCDIQVPDERPGERPRERHSAQEYVRYGPPDARARFPPCRGRAT